MMGSGNSKQSEQKSMRQRQREINKERREFQKGRSSDVVRTATYEAKEAKEAKEAQKEFDSNPERLARVDGWIATSSDLRPLRPEHSVNYNQVEAGARLDQWTERNISSDLDAPSREDLRSYEQKKSKIMNNIQKEIGGLSTEYFSDMRNLDKKRYNSPQQRYNTLMDRYRTFESDAQQVFLQQTIKMRQLAEKVGLTREQVALYTSDTEHGGIHQLPGKPQFNANGHLIWE